MTPTWSRTIVGEHLIQATSLDAQAKWQGTVTADSWAQKVVKISLSDMLPFWADPATGLTWAKKDNGSDATWSQANEYCRNLRLGGRSGWRVPTVDELWGIFDQTKAGQQGLHPKGGIRVSWPGVWSSTQGNNSEEKWAFSFYNGSRGSSKLGPSNINRALCVRGSGEWCGRFGGLIICLFGVFEKCREERLARSVCSSNPLFLG
jgi:hypothetical protein